MKTLLLIFSMISLSMLAQKRDEEVQIIQNQKKIEALSDEISVLSDEVELLKLQLLKDELQSLGLPSEDQVEHLGMFLSFNSTYKQANWVAHVISPEIMDGRVARTNDFRDDPKVTGEAIETDYFLKHLEPDSTYTYDGFGYDRGHLAPSADFAWSKRALSESYYYSNMSPQNPDFNREDWAEMEAVIRGYVWRNMVPLYIITVPLIEDGHERIDRGTHQLAIPQRFMKVALDVDNGRGIAFVMPNRKSDSDLADFAISIDRAEEISGFDFFPAWSDVQNNQGVENVLVLDDWFPASDQEGVPPLFAPDLPPKHINTTQAKRWMGSPKKVDVCGTVVSTRFSGSGNYWLNLDKKFPNTVFSVYIRKKDFIHFDSIHKDYLLNQKVCFNSKVAEMFSLPAMNIVRQEQVKEFVPIKK